MKHLRAIDGLRAVAVLSVVAYHAGLPVPAGFVGVDVFFVISGYLITRLLHEEVQATGRIDFMAFYARRARRILPALAVVILATLGLSVLLLPDASDVAKSAAAAGAFVANLFFAAQTSDYWAADSHTMPLLHLWSLSVEEQFYLVWPVVLILARRKPVAALATLAVASLALCEWWLVRSPSTAFYAMPARAWELALGGLVALYPLRSFKGQAWAGLALVLASCFVPLPHFPGLGALPAVVGSALLIQSIQTGERVACLEWKPVVYVGLISYSLYLWHWPLLALDHAMRAGETPLVVRLALVAAAFVLAAMSYRYVETPARRAKTKPRHAVAAGLTCVALLSGGALAFANAPKPPMDAATRAVTDFPKNRDVCHQRWREKPAFPVECQNKPGTPEVMLWGDSMAMTWQPFAYVLAGDRVAASYTRDSCPPLLDARPTNATEEARTCRDYNREALARAQHMRVVILAAKWVGDLEQDAAFGSELDTTLTALKGRTIYILGPTPTLPAEVPKCLRLHDLDACTIRRGHFDMQRAEVVALMKRLAREHGATYIEPVDFFCTPTACPGVKDGVALYLDSHHLTTTAATRFARQYLRR